MKTVLIVFALILVQANIALGADSKTVTRAPNSVVCIHHPTIECVHGYTVHEVEGCFKCVSTAVSTSDKDLSIDKDDRSCVTTPTLTCAAGHHMAREEKYVSVGNGSSVVKSCYHCTAPAVTDPTCVHHPDIDCASGFHPAEGEHGCYHCVK